MNISVLYFLVLIMALVTIGNIALIKNNRISKKILTVSSHLDRWSAYIFLVITLFFISLSRLNVLKHNVHLNSDESTFSANALRIRHGWFNWDSLDSLTSGPLNSIVLAWPYLFGLEVTYTTSRIMGLLIVSIVCFLIFLSLRRIGNTATAFLMTSPLVIFYGVATAGDFLHFSSEHTPLLLLFLATYGIIRTLDLSIPGDRRPIVFFMTALCLGAVPFAKLQAAPIAIVLGIILFLKALVLKKQKNEYWKRIYLLCIGALIPAVFFLLPLIINGNFHHFFISYILNALQYSAPALEFIQFVYLTRFYFLFETIFFTFALLTIVILSLFPFFNHLTTPDQRWALATILLAFGAAYFCVVQPGRIFAHYLHFILPYTVLTTGAVLAILIYSATPAKRNWILITSHIIIFIVIATRIIPEAKSEIEKNSFHGSLTFYSPNLLQWLQPKDTDSLLVWGWMAQYYLLTGITPATRESITEAQIKPSALKSYYQERFINDFLISKPNFIIDAITPTAFGFDAPESQSISFVPNLKDLIAQNYTMISKGHGNDCPRLYLSKEHAAAINLLKVEIAHITASGQYNEKTPPSNLDDNSVWENCVDWWTLPAGQLGFVDLHFSAVSSVSRVEVLNTTLDSTEHIRIVVLLKGEVVHQEEIPLNRYPKWTIYSLPQSVPAADTVRIEILKFSNHAAGLNEVKIFK